MPRFVLASFCAFLASCGGGAAAGVLATRADSAGITIVTNAGPSWRDGAGWRIDPEPLAQIGHRDDNDPRYDLLRVSAGQILPDGRLAVVVGGHREVRIYRPDGEWLRSIGRDGDGPGEMRFPTGLILAGDTLFLSDFQLSRLSAFSTDGTFLTSWPHPTANPGGQVPPSRRLADGRWLGSGVTSFTAGQTASGIDRTPITWYRISADLSRVEDTLFTLPGIDRTVITTTDASGQVTSMRVTTPSIGRGIGMTSGPDFLLTGDNTHPEMQLRTPDGTVTTIVRWNTPEVPIDAALLERLKQAELRRVAGDAAAEQVEARFRIPPATAVVPYFSGLHLDSDGNIWVREYAVFATDSVRFRVFHRDGQFLGYLALPPNHTVLDIAHGRILTVWRDDDDLEYLRVWGVREG